MKNMKTLLLVSAAAILGLVSCGGDGTSTDSGDDSISSTSVVATASSITNNLGSYPFTVGETIDLDEYITVNYNDGSTDQDFSVSCSSAGVTIEDHSVTFTAAGDYTLEIESGDGYRTIRASVTVKTAETMEVIDFLYPILNNTDNFTYKLYEYNYYYGFFSHYGTVAHTETYTTMYDPDDYGTVSLYSSFDGQILATLSDGNYYWGNFVDGGADVEFDPGIESNGSYYYIRMANILDPLDFDVYTDETYGDYIAGGTSVSEALFYNLSLGTSSYYTFGTCDLVAWVDNDSDGVYDEVVLWPSVWSDYYNQYIYYTDLIVGITDIGTTGIDVLDNAVGNADYLPDPIEYDDLGTALDALASAKNYTVEVSLYGYDYSNDEFYSDIPEDHFLNDWLGITKSIEQTNYVTEDGIYSEVTVYGDDDPSYEFAYFNNNSQGYYYANGTYPWDETYTYDHYLTAIEGVTDIFSEDDINYAFASNIDSSDLDTMNFSGYEEGEGYTTWEADVGYDDLTTKSDGLFEDILNQLSIFYNTTYGGLGSLLTYGGMYSSGTGSVSFDVSSWYDYITVYDDGSIDICAILYEPSSQYTSANSYAFVYFHFDFDTVNNTSYNFESLLSLGE